MNEYKFTKLATLCFSILTVYCLSAQTLPASLSKDQVAYYPFEGNGRNGASDIFDASPGGNFNYNPVGRRGKSIHLIGDDSIRHSGGGHVIFPDFGREFINGFTVSLWAKNESVGGNPFSDEAYISFGALDGNVAWIQLDTSKRILEFRVIGNGPNYPDGRIQLSIEPDRYAANWKHLAMTYEPGSFAAYIDGRRIGQTNVMVSIFPVSQAGIGRHWWDEGQSSSTRMTADIDEVRLFKRAITPEEANQIFALDYNISIPSLKVSVRTVDLISRVEIGRVYQLESGSSIGDWNKLGAPFTAIDILHTNQADVSDGDRYFRIQEIISQ